MSGWDAGLISILVGELVIVLALLVAPVIDRIPGMRFVGRVWDRLAFWFGQAVTGTATVIERLVRGRR